MTDAPSDPDALVSEFADDLDVVALVEMFVSELPARVAAIEQALASRAVDTLTRLADLLGEAASCYGFPAISDAARELQDTCQAGSDWRKLAKGVRKLARLCRHAKATGLKE